MISRPPAFNTFFAAHSACSPLEASRPFIVLNHINALGAPIGAWLSMAFTLPIGDLYPINEGTLSEVVVGTLFGALPPMPVIVEILISVL
jgi:hypothetical protein